MPSSPEIHWMLAALYGEFTPRKGALAAQPSAGGGPPPAITLPPLPPQTLARLERWAAALDAWLAERERTCSPVVADHSRRAWRRLLAQQRVMPWELTPAHLQAHADWMLAAGYSPSTLRMDQCIILSFYRWCRRHAFDPQFTPAFDPASALRLQPIRRYARLRLLSQDEVDRLLRAMQRDPTELGQRDYAFVLARLRLGVPLRSLQRLQWGQIELDGGAAWVRWRPGHERFRLPDDVWAAIQAALLYAGRLDSIRPPDYVFAPLAVSSLPGAGSRAEHWQASRPVSPGVLLGNLKRYGHLAGIPGEKLTLRALRLTAVRLRLDAGATSQEMRLFQDSRDSARDVGYLLASLPRLPAGQDAAAGGGAASAAASAEAEPALPSRHIQPFKGDEGLIHGYYADSHPPQGIAELAAEDVHGLDEQIVGLRTLARGLLERQEAAAGGAVALRLAEAYTEAARCLAELIRTESALQPVKSPFVEDFIAAINRSNLAQGKPPVSEQDLLAEALGGEDGMQIGARRLVEEVASLRYVLRKIFSGAPETQDVLQYMHYVDIYAGGSIRLARLLKMSQVDTGAVEAYLKATIVRAITRNAKEKGLY